jgi:hypothetical protein
MSPLRHRRGGGNSLGYCCRILGGKRWLGGKCSVEAQQLSVAVPTTAGEGPCQVPTVVCDWMPATQLKPARQSGPHTPNCSSAILGLVLNVISSGILARGPASRDWFWSPGCVALATIRQFFLVDDFLCLIE